MNLLVTGGTGALGRLAVQALSETQVVGSFSRSTEPVDRAIAHFSGDVRDLASLEPALAGVDVVIHLAALQEGQPPFDTFEINLRGTYNVLEGARRAGVRRIVFASSIAAVGCLSPEFIPDYLPIDEDHPCRPGTPYSASKAAAEVLCAAYSRQYGLDTVMLRIAGVRRPEAWLNPLSEDRRSPILWCWVHPDDVVRAIRASVEADVAGSLVVNVAAADTYSQLPSDYLAQRFCPGAQLRANRFDNAPDGRWPFYSIAGAYRALNWSPLHRFDQSIHTTGITTSRGGSTTDGSSM